MKAIEVNGLGKKYSLGVFGAQTLREEVQRWWARRRNGREAVEKPDAREFWALRDVSFTVEPGEVVGIIGRNGAGKSTLLKLLSRITEPTTGEAIMRGRVSSLLEVGTGFHPELTGRENVFLNGSILGLRRWEIAREFEAIVEFADLGRFIDTPVKRYSSGMYVRLAFSIAAHLQPEIMIVDEVLAVGDADFQRKCLGRMEEAAHGGRTILFVSHNMAAVRRLCGRAVWLDAGGVMATGESSEMLEKYLEAGEPKTTPSKSGVIFESETPEFENDCAIVRVEALDAEGNPMRSLRTWDTVRLRIRFRSRRRIERGSVAVSISTQEGVRLGLVSTRPDSNVVCRIEEGDGFADCLFPQWPYAAGHYWIGAGLAVPGHHFLCWTERIGLLEVEEQDVFCSGLAPSSRRYYVAVPHRWEMP